MTDKGIHYSKVDQTKVVVAKPTEKTVKDMNQKYKSAPLGYNTGTDAVSVVEEFLLDGPKMISGGIQTKQKVGTDKKPIPGAFEHSMMVVYTQSDPELKKFADVLTEVYKTCTKVVEASSVDFLKPGFQAAHATVMGFKNPVYWPVDKTTAKPIIGKSPSQWLKLYERKSMGSVEQTLFTDPSNKKIEWSKLRNVEMSFYPRLHVKSLYANGLLISMQMELRSAIVVGIRARNSQNDQKSMMAEINKMDPSLANTVAEQLKALTLGSAPALDEKDTKVAQTTPDASTDHKNPTTQTHADPLVAGKPMTDILGSQPTIPNIPAVPAKAT